MSGCKGNREAVVKDHAGTVSDPFRSLSLPWRRAVVWQRAVTLISPPQFRQARAVVDPERSLSSTGCNEVALAATKSMVLDQARIWGSQNGA